VVVQSGQSSNFSEVIQQLAAEFDEVCARPLRIPVRSLRQRQRRLERDEVEELAAAYRAGLDMKALAQSFGVHRTTVAGWLRRAGFRCGAKASRTLSCPR
jgi:hypothetical protein